MTNQVNQCDLCGRNLDNYYWRVGRAWLVCSVECAWELNNELAAELEDAAEVA